MIYIGTTESNGSAIYFDIYATVHQGRGIRISGTIGDGCYEGDVLVEVGRNNSVTFADAWLGGSGFAEFIERCNFDVLEKALLESVREIPLLKVRRSQPHGNSLTYACNVVSESSPVWSHIV